MMARLAILAALVVGTACARPEAERVRGGGPGADIGNRDGQLEMHEGSVIYHSTPCLTTLSECTGPLPLRTAKGS
jgi:hypothetical protein